MADEYIEESAIGEDRRHDPFTKVTADAILNEENGLTSTDIAVFCAICAFLGNTSRSGYPSQKSIARKARVSDRTVRRSIQKLEKAGYIEIEPRFRAGRQWSNKYHAVDKYLEVGRTNKTEEVDTGVLPQ